MIASWDAAAVCNYNIQPMHITHRSVGSALGMTRNHYIFFYFTFVHSHGE